MGIFKRKAKYEIPGSLTERELIQREAEIGAKIFGVFDDDRHREFFCLDEKTWVWYEEWNEDGRTHKVTTRYEIHDDNILKVQNDRSAQLLTGQELRNFYQAVRAYYYDVAAYVYKRPIPRQ